MEKKEENKPNEEELKPLSSKKGDKQLYWVLGVMAGLILLFLMTNQFFESLKNFEYESLDFTKTAYGKIPLYHYYYFSTSGITGNIVQEEPRLVNLYLRNDPRENPVPIEGEIEFPDKGKVLYIGLDSDDFLSCEYSSVALASLSSFLTQNGFTVRGGVIEKEEAEKNNLTYVGCDVNPDNSKILIRPGEETKIIKEENNCYVVEVVDCEILNALEKFEVQTIIDARERSGTYYYTQNL